MSKLRNTYVRFYTVNELGDNKVYTGDYGKITKIYRAGDSDTAIDNEQVQPVSREYTFNHLDESILYDESNEQQYNAFIEARTTAIERLKEEARNRTEKEQEVAGEVFYNVLYKLGIGEKEISLVMSALNLKNPKQEVVR